MIQVNTLPTYSSPWSNSNTRLGMNAGAESPGVLNQEVNLERVAICAGRCFPHLTLGRHRPIGIFKKPTLIPPPTLSILDYPSPPASPYFCWEQILILPKYIPR